MENESKKVNILLTHIPTNYFDDILALTKPNPIDNLTLQQLEDKLEKLFKPEKTVVKALIDFDRR